MKKIYSFFFPCTSLFLISGLFTATRAIACDPGESEVEVVISADYPYGITWTVKDEGGTTYGSGGSTGGNVCVPDGVPMIFTINGYFYYETDYCQVSYNGTLGGEIDGTTLDGGPLQIFLAFPEGANCFEAESTDLGTHLAPGPDYWYAFTPDTTGSFEITTCDLGNTCDTKLWVYSYCLGLNPVENAEGTYAYNDNYCGDLARISTILVAGNTYYIRVGDADDACEGTPINWALNFLGAPAGCTDPFACNYAPLAETDDGSCMYPGNPDCPSGPDLVLDPTLFDGGVGGYGADFTLQTVNTSDPYTECYYEEGALTGLGLRYVLEFGIRIWNMGDEDYHIGHAGESPYLVWDPCHGHYHYIDYGEYILYDSLGNEIPAGHKNGFAVMDLCGAGGYNGYDMGISAGCYDMYGQGTGGQWVDISDVPDGTYTLVARVNWENHPDIDGRTETNLANNWLSTCLNITHDASGAPIPQIVDSCTTYIDCLGEIFGNAFIDCNGDCGGWRLLGDLNLDTARTYDDVQMYTDDILDNTIVAQSCNDANSDAYIDVVDAAMVMGCANESMGYTHDKPLCSLPAVYYNSNDTVTLSIGEVNDALHYLDIYSYNPGCRVMGMQFTMQGLTIDSVQNLCAETYGTNFKISYNDTKVIALGYGEVGYQKRTEPIPILRIYYTTTYPTDICIKHFTAAVNDDFEEVPTAYDNACVTLTSAGALYQNPDALQVNVFPNPFDRSATFSFTGYYSGPLMLQVLDLSGKLLRTYGPVSGGTITMDRGSLPAGMYIYKVTGDNINKEGKVVIE